MTTPFLGRLAHQKTGDRLSECFPFQVLTAEALVEEFYDYYGISQ